MKSIIQLGHDDTSLGAGQITRPAEAPILEAVEDAEAERGGDGVLILGGDVAPVGDAALLPSTTHGPQGDGIAPVPICGQ